ncbi:MAG: hypothetical protein AB8B61_10225 [Cyclobacteriaceae bacterium]
MHEIEPYYGWLNRYNSVNDPHSPFYEKVHNELSYTDTIYGYYIHPQWDFIGSETLYIKVLFTNYEEGVAIIELIGEWNDTLHNDIMHLKRNLIDELIPQKITKFILIGESVFNFHGSDDCYYEEWFEEIEDGWITAINFRDFIQEEWSSFHIDYYFNFGGEELEIDNWRTMTPQMLYQRVNQVMQKRISI